MNSNQIIQIKNTGEVLLKTNSRPRNIGTIKDGVLYQSKFKAKHFFRMFNAYGFPYELIAEHGSRFKIVNLLIDGKENLYITPATILKMGVIKTCLGFETQIFVNIKHFALNQQQALDYCNVQPETKRAETTQESFIFA